MEADESPSAAIIREINEELGVEIKVDALRPVAFAEETLVEGARPLVILLYTVADWAGEPVALDPGAAIGWFKPAEIAALDRPPLDRQLCAQIFPETDKTKSRR